MTVTVLVLIILEFVTITVILAMPMVTIIRIVMLIRQMVAKQTPVPMPITVALAGTFVPMLLPQIQMVEMRLILREQ